MVVMTTRLIKYLEKQLPDVMEVVVEAQQLFNTSKSTNNKTEDEDTE